MAGMLDLSLNDFLKQAASDAPVPGGGGISALAGALGAAMGAMAAGFTVGREKYAAFDAECREILRGLESAVRSLAELVDADAGAFSAISDAYKLPKGTPEEKELRRKAVEKATRDAMGVPMRMLERCREAALLLPRLAEAGNANLVSDVEVAAIMLDAAAKAARVNVMVNARFLGPEAENAADGESAVLAAEVAKASAGALAAAEARRNRK